MVINSNPKLYRLGENAIVLDCRELFPALSKLAIQSRIWRLASICRKSLEFEDIVPGMNNLTLFLYDAAQITFWLSELQQKWHNIKGTDLPAPLVEIPVVYGGKYGPDLEKVARLHQLETCEVIRRHSAVKYTVLFLGFQPGFPYLDGLDVSLFTPRLSTPRLSIPAGSVGIGGNQTGIYPAQAPGGWQLIGRTNATLFNPELSQSPTLLAPGYRVNFIPVPSLAFIS